jgi:hypothetical protein
MSSNGKVFNWYWDEENSEYEIYLGMEIFCHLSETDFFIFEMMCIRCEYDLMKRIV